MDTISGENGTPVKRCGFLLNAAHAQDSKEAFVGLVSECTE